MSAEGLLDPNKVFTEDDWNPLTYEDGLGNNKAISYRVSKTIAERSAWTFVEEEKPHFDLVTICPPLIFGPILQPLSSLSSINTSNQRFVDLIQGKWKHEIQTSIGVNFWADVRDVAAAHILVFEKPDAGNKRFICSAGKFCNRDIVAIAHKHLPILPPKLKDMIPSDDEVSGGDYPDVVPGCDNSRATQLLGIEWIDFEECVVDTIRSLLAVR